jgi:hypothetical protein
VTGPYDLCAWLVATWFRVLAFSGRLWKFRPKFVFTKLGTPGFSSFCGGLLQCWPGCISEIIRMTCFVCINSGLCRSGIFLVAATTLLRGIGLVRCGLGASGLCLLAVAHRLWTPRLLNVPQETRGITEGIGEAKVMKDMKVIQPILRALLI